MKKRRIISNNIYMLKMLFRIKPMLIIWMGVISILTTMIPVICNVLLLQYIINAVLQGGNIIKIFYVTFAVAIYILVVTCLASLFNEYYFPANKEIMYREIQKRLDDKAVRLDISCYDDPQYYNELVWNMTSIEQKLDTFFDCLKSFPGYVASFVTTIAVFTMIDFKMLLLVIVTVLLTLVFNKPLAKRNYDKENDLKECRHKKMYIEQIFRRSEFAQELRLSSISKVLLKKYSLNQIDMETRYKKHNSRLWIINFMQVYFSGYFMVNFVIVLYLGYQILVNKTVRGGDFIAVFNGVDTLLNALFYIVGKFARQITESGYFFENYRKFMELQPKIISGSLMPAKEFNTLELRNVSFSYENGREVLHDVNLKISKGDRIALVGLNGAGKTTLIKLIMRLYDVSEGSILLNGINIREYDLKQYQRIISVAFQDFQVYATSLGCNISGDTTYNEKKAHYALAQCGLNDKVGTLDKGLETELTREFNDDGIILSGGEKQKVALARALYSKASLLILDEPSAALDPLAEQQLNQTIIDTTKDKTVIFISHRLSTTVNADYIYVLSAGHILEKGKHKNLLALNGEYAKMWKYQADRYTKGQEKLA